VSEPPFSQDARALVVAHRGASAVEAENTLPAFERAIAAGADAVEFDVRMTADGVAVVMHDAEVSRTTDGAGRVRDLTLDEVKELRVRTADGGETEVPTLEETLRLCTGRVGVDVEIKNIPGEPDFERDREAAVEATLRALDGTAFSGFVVISSFNPLSLARSRALAPEVPTGLLTDPTVEARVAATFAHAEGHPWVLPFIVTVQDAGPGFAREVHAMDVRIGTWLTDDPEVAVGLMREGLDAVATNDPATIVAARAEAGLR
jgi:glycerophosphoryl diester phosphodiesterase